MPFLLTLIRGRAALLLPFLLPFAMKHKKKLMLLAAALFAYPLISRLLKGVLTNVNPLKLQYENEVYKNIAAEQFEAMDNTGTDEDLLFESLEGLNSEDLKAVYNAFGEKRYAVNSAPVLIPWFYPHKNLIQWYIEELDAEELAKMKQIWKGTGLWV
tara:strand:- start:210 stop:680 length:471 start_codon:yes stop_codon:yes gene_type:complete